MSAIKNYMEDVVATTAEAMFAEAEEELKAYGDFDTRTDLEDELFETLCGESARSIWDMIHGLIGDMPWNVEHPLLDEAKNQILTLIPFGDLAKDLAEFYDEYDPYGFRDCFDEMDEAIEANLDILESDDEGVIDWLNECIEDMDGDEYWKNTIPTCHALIDRVKFASAVMHA